MFGFQHAEIKPDLVTTAKSLAGGLPISGVVGKAAIMDAPLEGGLGGTYGGNPLACAAALAVIEAFEQEDLLSRGNALADKLMRGLVSLQQKFNAIGEVRGLGFMLAIEIVGDRSTKTPDAELTQRIVDEARQGGLLVIKCGVHRNVIRFLAPLVTTDSQLDEAISILDSAFSRATI
jgi:4-aminobutyrate aminotransferase/(S)-3-amino-2-methylpropionate transaminase